MLTILHDREQFLGIAPQIVLRGRRERRIFAECELTIAPFEAGPGPLTLLTRCRQNSTPETNECRCNRASKLHCFITASLKGCQAVLLSLDFKKQMDESFFVQRLIQIFLCAAKSSLLLFIRFHQ